MGYKTLDEVLCQDIIILAAGTFSPEEISATCETLNCSGIMPRASFYVDETGNLLLTKNRDSAVVDDA